MHSHEGEVNHTVKDALMRVGNALDIAHPALVFAVETNGGRIYSSTALQPTKPLTTDWLQNATNYYVHSFVVHPEMGMPGLQNQIPELFALFPDKIYFQSAFQAVALAHLARANQMNSEHHQKARGLHHKAIREFRIALDDLEEARSATALMTTELLWQYDLILGISQSPATSFHRKGMLRILQLRLDQAPDDLLGVTQGAFVGLTIQTIGERPPGIENSMVDSMISLFPRCLPWSPDDLCCHLLGLLCQSLGLCHGTSRVNVTTDGLKNLASLLAQLNNDLLFWETSLPDDWKYSVLPKPSASAQEEEIPNRILIFPKPNAMILWNCYWMARLGVLQCFHEHLIGDSRSPSIQDDMLLLVDNICAAIPHVTGQIEQGGNMSPRSAAKNLTSLFAMRSLVMATNTAGLSAAKKGWMLQQLEYIGRRNGIGEALESFQKLQGQ